MARRLLVAGILLSSGFLFAAAPSAPPPAASPTPDVARRGREVFTRKNCSHCHSIAVAGIVRTGDDAKMFGPDLSDVGLHFEEGGLAAYLRSGQRVKGRRHWKSFWGEEADLAALAAWLEGLRNGAAAAPAPTPTPVPKPAATPAQRPPRR